MFRATRWITVDEGVYRVVEKPTHTVIYRRYGRGPYRDVLVWSSRNRLLKVGTIFARVLVAAKAHEAA
jgi:hypothetical protein